MKRVLKWLGIVVAVLAVAFGAIWYTAFGSNSAIAEGQIAPGVESVKDGFVSAYLLDAGAGKVALVDAGKDAAAEAILAALKKRGLGPDAVAAIFITHGHGDHTAGCEMFPAAEVYVLEADVALVGDAAKVTKPLKDGDVSQVGELRVETFAVPGHTPGSAVFFADGVLFFGDSAGASKDGVVMKAVRLFSKDTTQNVAALKALTARLAPRAADVKMLAFAHTGPLPGFDPLLAFAAKP